MKGIVLAGGTGSRLYPATQVVNKHLLPVYDKPMIYYPLSTLMLAGIREILLITTPRDLASYQALLGEGGQWGVDLRYAVQPAARGIAEALLIARDFLAGASCALILGDNVVFGEGLAEALTAAVARNEGATVFARRVSDPQNYGVVTLGPGGEAVSLDEKPASPRSPWAVAGLYLYDHQAADIAGEIEPSSRGELEITDVNRAYLRQGALTVQCLGRETAWFDCGTGDRLLAASSAVRAAVVRRGRAVGCIEEAAWRQGYIDANQLARLAGAMRNPDYRVHLDRLLRTSDAA